MRSKNRAAAQLGRLGGKARAQKLTIEERIESARKAAEARWGKRKFVVEEIAESPGELRVPTEPKPGK